MVLKSSPTITRLALALCGAWAMAFSATSGAQMTYTGTEGCPGASCTTVSGPGTTTGPGGTVSFGTLALPADIDFGDILGNNATTSPDTITDTWTFSVGSAGAGGGSVTGDAILLQNFSLVGITDTIKIVDTTTGTTLFDTSVPNGSFALPYFIADTTTNNRYSLQITSTVPAQSSNASYTGVLLLEAIPEPTSWLLTIAGICAVASGMYLRRSKG